MIRKEAREAVGTLGFCFDSEREANVGLHL